MTLSGDEIENNKVNKLINWIIKEFDLIANVIKNDEFDSLDNSIIEKTDKILAKSKKHQEIVKTQKKLQRPDIWNNLPT